MAGIRPRHEASIALGDGKDYRDRTRKLALPIKEEGAYLVVCRGDNLHASGLVVVTPLKIEVQVDTLAGRVRTTREGPRKISARRRGQGHRQRQRRFRLRPDRPPRGVRGRRHRRRRHGDRPVRRLALRLLSGQRGRGGRGEVPPRPFVARPSAGRGATAARCSADEEKINEALDSPTAMDFHEQPLSDVVEYLKERHGIRVQLDVKSLTDVGVSGDTPVTKAVKGVSLRSALRLLLRDYGLTYLIKDEVLLITTPEKADEELLTRIYPVADLVLVPQGGEDAEPDFDTLVDVVTSTIRPTSWEDVGGPGSVRPFPNKLSIVVSQTQEVHEELEDLLEQLRAAGQRPNAHGPHKPSAHRSGARNRGGMGGMGGMGGGMGGMGGGTWGGPPAKSARAGAGKAEEPDLLEGVQETNRGNQGKQSQKLQKTYERGGGMGGVGGGMW